MWSREDGSIADSVLDSGSESDRNISDGGSEHEKSRNGTRQHCRSRNAILARKNRLKKKRHMEKLENEVKRLRAENDALRKETRTHDETAQLLRKRTRYLEGVLANSTELQSLLGAIRGCGLPTASSLLARTQPVQGNPPPQPDHIYSKTQPAEMPLWQLQAETLPEELDVPDESLFDFKFDDEPLFPDAGICLHVAKQRVSLEFCSSCHSNAEQAWADL